jgi:hypothetical protein
MARLAAPIEHAQALAAALVDDGDAFAGFIGAHLAGVIGDTVVLLRAMTHKHISVWSRAARQLKSQMVPWSSVRDAQPQMSIAARRLLWKLWANRSGETLSKRDFDDAVQRVGEREAACLLVRLAPSDVATLLPRYDSGISGARALVRVHAVTVAAHVREHLAGVEASMRPTAWREVYGWFSLLVSEAPLRAMSVAQEFLEEAGSTSWRWLPLGTLVHADPAAFASLMRVSTDVCDAVTANSAQLRSAFHRLDDDTLVHWAKNATDGALADALRGLSMKRRASVLHRCRNSAIDDASLATVLLDVAPLILAADLARRQRAKAAVAADPIRALKLCAYLPLAEAQPLLAKAAVTAEAAVRALSLSLVATAAGRHQRRDDVLAAALEQLDRIKNEQDPVRQMVVQAWARVPAARFTSGCAPWLVRIAEHVCDARDTSPSTRHALHQLSSRVLVAAVVHSDDALLRAALQMMQKSAGRDGSVSFTFRDVDVPPRAVLPLIAALRTQVDDAIERSRPDVALSLATALGRRAYENSDVDAWLWRIVRQGKTHESSRAAQLLLQAPRMRDERVAQFLALDTSFVIVCPTLQRHLHVRRQDLLAPIVDVDRALTGRFADKKARWMWPLSTQLWRWSPADQRRLIAMAGRAIDDDKHVTMSRAWAIAVRSAVPCARIADFASALANKDVVVVEAALRALSCLDDPTDATPTLLEYVDGDRARVAMYAVHRALLSSPPQRTRALLEGVLSSKAKITAKKEALRLLGSLRIDGGVDVLERHLAADVHKDLRVAAGHALRQRLDDPRTFALLQRLATSTDSDGPRSLVEVSRASVPPPGRPQHLSLLLLCAQHADARVREAAYGALPAWSIDDVAGSIVDRLVSALLDADDFAWGEAARGLSQLLYMKSAAWARLPQLLSMPARDDRDLIGEQRLRCLTTLMCAASVSERRRGRAVLTSMASTLAGDERMLLEAVELRIAAVDATDAEAWRAAVAFLPDIDMTAWQAVVRKTLSAEAPARLLPLLSLANGNAREAIVALTAAALLHEEKSNVALSTDAIHKLRAHDDASVRRSASRVVVVEERQRLTPPPDIAT